MKAGTRVRLDNFPADDAPIGEEGTVVGLTDHWIKVVFDDKTKQANEYYDLFSLSELKVIE
jgi:hypothetical protein